MMKILTKCKECASFAPSNKLVTPLASFSATEGHHSALGSLEFQRAAFKDDTTWLLFNKYLIFQLCRFPFFVKNSQRLTEVGAKIIGKPCS